MLSKEREAEVLRLFYAEKWKIGTIASQLSIHHATVRRILARAGAEKPAGQPRASKSDPYVPLIIETLAKYPKLPASRLWQMAIERGYTGAADHFRTIVGRYRPRAKAEAYLRLRTLPGEQGQIDWGHFGTMVIGRAQRKLMAFVMVLSWSRRLFLRFYLDAKMGSFLHGHVSAFEFFGGVPRVALYDNLRSAVLERQGDAIRFHPTLLELAAHYRYEPRPVAIARGNEKGRVERAIRYIRTSFFAGREYRDLQELNEQALQWCLGVASARPCPEDSRMTVQQAYEQEQPKLLPLPPDGFAVEDRDEVAIGKTPYARFDLNDYSVPSEYVRQTLQLRATLDEVRLLQGTDVIATHPRCWDREQTVEDPSHVAELVQYKREARLHRGLDRLVQAAPSTRAFYEQLASNGINLGGATSALLTQLELFGASALEEALAEALQRGTVHVGAVCHLLDHHRHERGQPPPVGRHLPRDGRVQGPVVQAHRLSDYDQLGRHEDDQN